MALARVAADAHAAAPHVVFAYDSGLYESALTVATVAACEAAARLTIHLLVLPAQEASARRWAEGRAKLTRCPLLLHVGRPPPPPEGIRRLRGVLANEHNRMHHLSVAALLPPSLDKAIAEQPGSTSGHLAAAPLPHG